MTVRGPDPTLQAQDRAFDRGSFRDRGGRVFRADGRILRTVDDAALGSWHALSRTRFFAESVRAGKLPATRELAPDEVRHVAEAQGWHGVLDHDPVPFVSYPFEWSFGMLRQAGLLQLELLAGALREGLTMKDATPYNVQWRGARPVFIDIPSFEPYRDGEPWVGYRQFCELYLYPLLLEAYRGIPFQPLLRGRLEGVEAPTCLAAMSARDLARPGVLTHVWLHARAQQRFADRPVSAPRDVAAAGFGKALIERNVAGLTRLLRNLRPRRRSQSAWVGYRETCSYDDRDRATKSELVDRVAAGLHPAIVWDLGANTGEFSRIAARHAGYVLALDADTGAVERLFGELAGSGEGRVLPLVFDIADPSPALGWRGEERPALWDRGRPDLVLALALIHHLVIGANLPLAEVVAWLASLGGDLVIEFVAKDDPMTQRLLRHKADQYTDYDQAHLEACLARSFEIDARVPLARGTRWLYSCRQRAGTR
ncbi:MAG: class I SAM-dependent methyltransferase [Acidobacteriota bacterium]